MSKISGRERLLKKMAAIPQAIRKDIATAIEAGANDIVSLQKQLAPKQSGDLRNSIRAVKGSYTPENANVRGMSASAAEGNDPDLTVHIVAGDDKAWYARLVEFGTAPHEIRPKRPGGLLNVYGRMIESVSHPGAKPRPFFYPAYRALRRRVKGRITRATKRAIKKVASE